MLTLLDDALSPITKRIGYLNAELRALVSVHRTWLESLYHRVDASPIDGDTSSVLSKLPPLSSERSRIVWADIGKEWTAYFDNGINGGDLTTEMHVLSKQIGCRLVNLTTSPSVRTPGTHIRNGAVECTVSGSKGFEWGRTRSVMASEDGGRWSFDLVGEPEPFEEVEKYTSRRIRDRFTSEMLQSYCRAVGIDVFNRAAYGPRAVLIEYSNYIDKWTPKVLEEYGQYYAFPPSAPRPKPLELSLTAAQEGMGIVPGLASTLPG